jgi:RNA polymerase sigma factor (sigma-70 family)
MKPIVSTTILRAQTDARLIALTRQGHEPAFETIVQRYRKSVLRYCRRFLPEARAEDALQQAFLNAWAALRGGAEVTDLRRWLYRVAHNAALDAASKAGYDYEEFTEALRLSPAPEAEVERRLVMRRTLTGLAALPARQREALLRTAVHGESQAEIARDLRVSEPAVGQLVHRARAAMRSAISALIPVPLVNWAVGLGGHPPIAMDDAVRDLVAGSSAAGGASVALKAGGVVAIAGLLAVSSGGGPYHASNKASASTKKAADSRLALAARTSRAEIEGQRRPVLTRLQRRSTPHEWRRRSPPATARNVSANLLPARTTSLAPDARRDVWATGPAEGDAQAREDKTSRDTSSDPDSGDIDSTDKSSDSGDDGSDRSDSGSGDSHSDSGDSGSNSDDSGSGDSHSDSGDSGSN